MKITPETLKEEFLDRKIDQQFTVKEGSVGEHIRNENLAWLDTVYTRLIQQTRSEDIAVLDTIIACIPKAENKYEEAVFEGARKTLLEIRGLLEALQALDVTKVN